MQITINIDGPLTADEKQLLLSIAGDATRPSAVAAAPAAKAAPKAESTPKAAPKAEKAVEEPEEDVEETTSDDADGPTRQDAVDLVTKLVSGGEAPKVKKALADHGVKRVSELGDDDIAAFVAALS